MALNFILIFDKPVLPLNKNSNLILMLNFNGDYTRVKHLHYSKGTYFIVFLNAIFRSENDPWPTGQVNLNGTILNYCLGSPEGKDILNFVCQKDQNRAFFDDKNINFILVSYNKAKDIVRIMVIT